MLIEYKTMDGPVSFPKGLTVMPVNMNAKQSAHEKARVDIHPWMIRRDMAQILAIEEQSFEFPWPEEEFDRCRNKLNCLSMVSECREKIVGYMVYKCHNNYIALLNVAVHPEMKGRRIGEQMVEKLKSKLSSERHRKIIIKVRETNLGAQLFFREMGFKAISLLRDYYDVTEEDAYVMQYHYSQKSVIENRKMKKMRRTA